MAEKIQSKDGAILARPSGSVLAIYRYRCSKAINTPQHDAHFAITGGTCQDTQWNCTLVNAMPSPIRFCESWQTQTWAGSCCWVFNEYISLVPWGLPEDWIFQYVLILRWQPAGYWYRWYDGYGGYQDFNYPAGWSAEVYVGSDYSNPADPRPRCEWMTGADPMWVSTGVNTLQVGEDRIIRGTIDMEGRESGWGGADATGLTGRFTFS